MTDWAIPQQAKLKYTQLFNLHDRSRSGFLSGLQCRDILLQSGLHRNVLAEIWNLSDIDGDGQLTREEFILAMHLTNQVRSGQDLPIELPQDLVPPSYRRARSISATSVNSATSASSTVSGGGNNEDQISQKSSEGAASSTGSILNTNSFEDKRRENFEKGRAELERRRLKIIEQQSSIIKEQLEASKKQVSEAKAKIDSMRGERDTKMGLITSLEAQLKAVQDRKIYLQQEELNLIAIAKDLNLMNPAQIELDELATQAKQQSINQMKEKLNEFSVEKEKKVKELADITNRLEGSKKDLKSVSEKVKVIYGTYKEKIAKAKVVREQIIDENKSKAIDLDSVWGAETGFGSQSPFQPDPKPVVKDDPWTAKSDTNSSSKAFGLDDLQNSMTSPSLSHAFENSKAGNGVEDSPKPPVKRYRALYAFDARNPDELTINPGDTIIGSGEVCEPGWLSGQIGGRTGLFPEAYVEPLEDESEITAASLESSSTQNQLAESLEKSLTITPTNKYRVLYAFEARNPDELSIEPGDVVTEIEGAHEPEWLCGELRGRRGLFPEAYVEKMPEELNQQENQPGVSRLMILLLQPDPLSPNSVSLSATLLLGNKIVSKIPNSSHNSSLA